MSDDIIDSFYKIKSLVYDNSYKKYKMNEIASLIMKPNKSKEDIEILKKISEYSKIIQSSLEDLGTKVLELNSVESTDFSNINLKKIEEHVRDVVLQIDLFIDALVAILRVCNYDGSKFQLKNISTYLKAIRNKFVSKANEFKLKMIRNPKEEINFKSIVNDTIDLFIREAYSLRISILDEKIEKELQKYDSKHDNN